MRRTICVTLAHRNVSHLISPPPLLCSVATSYSFAHRHVTRWRLVLPHAWRTHNASAYLILRDNNDSMARGVPRTSKLESLLCHIARSPGAPLHFHLLSYAPLLRCCVPVLRFCRATWRWHLPSSPLPPALYSRREIDISATAWAT